MLDARFATIEAWPGQATNTRKPAPFGSSYQKLLDDLERELRHLGAQNITIQAFISRDDIRNDGWPRSNAKFYSPGVIVSFTTKHKAEVSFPCDTYADWMGNLRAVSLTLTALRAIDRYGVSKRDEQYTGWKRLAAPGRENRRDAEWALAHLAHLAEVQTAAIRNNATAIDLAYRAAAKRTHPDSGGNPEAFQLLQEAVTILRDSAGR